ncbi:HTH_Tnp_Tc3_2 domain-containing protein [Trichonephila clavipes]|nr:HTH_Tnp_Tc3_2 domain-containing protein [Trichonephila clavipes]
MSLGNGTRSVPPSHIEIVAESLCGWACLRESVLIGGSNVASRRGFEIEDFLQYGFGGNVQILSIRLCCGWSMALREFQKSEMAQARTLTERFLERARKFIKRCETELDWEDLSDDTIMDIGCGDHFLCTRALLEKFPRIGCLVAIDTVDVMSEEIMEDEFFAEYFRKKILQFRLLDITDWKIYYREIAKIVGRSHSCVQKIIGGFRNDGLIENKSGRGRKCILSDVAKRKVLKDIKIDPKLSKLKLAAGTSRIMGRSVSAETLRNVIRHALYSSVVAREKPVINLQNQKKRLEFTKLIN